MARVILVSTMWDKVAQDIGTKREDELRERFWKALLDKGSDIDRLQRMDSTEAWRIVKGVIQKHEKREGVLLQEELVDLKKRLNETEAGKTLYSSLQALLADQKSHLQDLLTQMDTSGADPRVKQQLEKEYRRLDEQFQKTFQEIGKLKITLSRRILMGLSPKKTNAVSLSCDGRKMPC